MENIAKDKPVVLVVDDQPFSRDFFSIILRKLECPFLLANDGQAALDLIGTNDIDIVFMDIEMPGMSGSEAISIMRKRFFKKPAIAVTANTLPNEVEQYRKAGFDDVLAKPFTRIDAESMIQKWDSRLLVSSSPAIKMLPSFVPGKVFDSELMLANFMNDEKAVLPMLSHFLERTALQIENFSLQEKSGDLENAKRNAHMIKGSAKTMGGIELGEAAAKLEKAYKDASWDEIRSAYPLLKKLFALYKEKAEEFLKSRG